MSPDHDNTGGDWLASAGLIEEHGPRNLALAWLPNLRAGIETQATLLGSIAIKGITGGLHSLTIRAIPVGAVLTDVHGNSFTVSSGNTSVDVTNWDFSALSITPPGDANFTL